MALRRRLDAYLSIPNDVIGQQIINFVNNNLNFNRDVWTGNDLTYKKNLNIKIQSDMDGLNKSVIATYLFKNANRALNTYNKVIEAVPVGCAGVISLHYYPEEGTEHSWRGCKNDPSADYRETIWE